MLTLSKRLGVIAELVKSGSSVCDVGTDHGYLPAFLYLSGKCKSVVATDIREKPLENARQNLKKLGAESVRLMLCDGLQEVNRDMADTVIIAGMGGEVISGIIDRAEFVKDHSVELILQPMTAADSLREYLAQKGFEVEREIAVGENGKIYSVMTARFGGVPYELSDIRRLIGLLTPFTAEAKQYIQKQAKIVSKCASDLECAIQKRAEYLHYKQIAEQLEMILRV